VLNEEQALAVGTLAERQWAGRTHNTNNRVAFVDTGDLPADVRTTLPDELRDRLLVYRVGRHERDYRPESWRAPSMDPAFRPPQVWQRAAAAIPDAPRMVYQDPDPERRISIYEAVLADGRVAPALNTLDPEHDPRLRALLVAEIPRIVLDIGLSVANEPPMPDGWPAGPALPTSVAEHFRAFWPNFEKRTELSAKWRRQTDLYFHVFGLGSADRAMSAGHVDWAETPLVVSHAGPHLDNFVLGQDPDTGARKIIMIDYDRMSVAPLGWGLVEHVMENNFPYTRDEVREMNAQFAELVPSQHRQAVRDNMPHMLRAGLGRGVCSYAWWAAMAWKEDQTRHDAQPYRADLRGNWRDNMPWHIYGSVNQYRVHILGREPLTRHQVDRRLKDFLAVATVPDAERLPPQTALARLTRPRNARPGWSADPPDAITPAQPNRTLPTPGRTLGKDKGLNP
jgi:hypothetical protein